MGPSALFFDVLGIILSNYEVIARKWRPQNFSKLIGQDHVSRTLLNAIKSERVPHALLFTGPRGTGKTSSARIMAKALRCTEPTESGSCGQCKDCVDITKSRHIDVIEIDGASNNGVDSVRELRDSVGYLPSSGKYKIYIIDEVHMLSTSAFNALLKTLEEPPEHVIFIMATTEVQKLPNTILSRCQRFDFKLISHGQIEQHLQLICENEKITFEKEALWTVAKCAKGSMRDAQSLLDQLITFSNSSLTLDNVTMVLGISPRELVHQCFQAITSQNSLAMYEISQKLNSTGIDPMLFIEEFMEFLKNALVIKIKAHKSNTPLDLPDSEITFLEKSTSGVSIEDIHFLFDLTLEGSLSVSKSMDSRLALEMLLLKLTSAPKIQRLSELLESGVPTVHQTPQHNVGNAQQPTQAQPRKLPPLRPPGHQQSYTQSNPSTPARPVTPKRAAQNDDPWTLFVTNVKKANGFLGALLEHTSIVDQSATEIHLGLPEKMNFLSDKLKDEKNKAQLEKYIETFWNKKLKVNIQLFNQKKKPIMTPRQKEKKADQDLKNAEREMVENHPLVKKTKEVFKTEIVSIK